MPDVIIEAKNLTKFYGPIKGIESVDFEFHGGTLGILGPNGSGKSTMIKCLIGLWNITEGESYVLGYNSSKDARRIRQLIGYMPEAKCIPLDMDGISVCTYFGRLVGMPKADAMQRAHECLDYVGLKEQRYRKTGTYSAGMIQRLKMAQALVHDPDLLLIDAPTNGLDPVGREEMLELIRDLNRNGKHILLSSHILPDVEETCESTLILSEGHLVKYGNLNDLLTKDREFYKIKVNNPETFYEILVNDGMMEVSIKDEILIIQGDADVPSKVIKLAAANNFQLMLLDRERYTLEEFFVELMKSQDI